MCLAANWLCVAHTVLVVAGDWAAFNTPTSSSMSTPAAAPWHAQSMGAKVQFTPPPKTLRPPSEADLAAVAEGQSLQLLETWQGSFLGSKLVKAGLTLEHQLRFTCCLVCQVVICFAASPLLMGREDKINFGAEYHTGVPYAYKRGFRATHTAVAGILTRQEGSRCVVIQCTAPLAPGVSDKG